MSDKNKDKAEQTNKPKPQPQPAPPRPSVDIITHDEGGKKRGPTFVQDIKKK